MARATDADDAPKSYLSGFLNAGRSLANVRRVAELCCLASVLNGQTPRLTRSIFDRVCLIGAKESQLGQFVVSLHAPSPLKKRLNRITLDSDFKLQRSLIFACSTLSRGLGLLNNKTPALSCAITAASSSRISISRLRRGKFKL